MVNRGAAHVPGVDPEILELILELGEVKRRSILSCWSALWVAPAGRAQLASTSASTLGTRNLTSLRTRSPPLAMDGAGKETSGRPVGSGTGLGASPPPGSAAATGGEALGSLLSKSPSAAKSIPRL